MKKLLFFLFPLFIACDSPKKPAFKYPKYHVTVGNSVGHEGYDCERYERPAPNTYVLYDDKGQMIIEITISNGYYFEVQPGNKYYNL